jgi:hypothetical protein
LKAAVAEIRRTPRIEPGKITIVPEKFANFKLRTDDTEIGILIEETLFVRFKDAFLRATPTPDQRKRLNILRNLMRAAYKKGLEDGPHK